MRENKIKSRGFGSSLLRRVRVSGVVVGLILVLVSSCSMNRKFERGGTMLGTLGGVGTGHYMCQSSGFGPKFGIGCMVLGGLFGGVLGGIMGERFDNSQIYNSVENYSVHDEPKVYRMDEGGKMKVKITDDYVEDQGYSIVGDKTNTWCKDFEFEVEKDGQYQRGKGKSCKDEFGKWETMGIDLLR